MFCLESLEAKRMFSTGAGDFQLCVDHVSGIFRGEIETGRYPIDELAGEIPGAELLVGALTAMGDGFRGFTTLPPESAFRPIERALESALGMEVTVNYRPTHVVIAMNGSPDVGVDIGDIALTIDLSTKSADLRNLYFGFDLESNYGDGALDARINYTGELATDSAPRQPPGDGETDIFEGVLYINGTSGDDEIYLEDGGDHVIVGGTSPDFLKTFARTDFTAIEIRLGGGNDYFAITGNVGSVTADLGDGDDEFLSGDGNDTIDAAAGNDYVFAGAGNDVVHGSDGRDTLAGGAGRNRLFGGAGEDRLSGSGGRDFLNGEAGDDRLYGNGGSDVLDGGGNVDRLFGGPGNDKLSGGSSNDKLYGESGNDTLTGGRGADLLVGNAGDDMCFALDDAADMLMCGSGIDTAECDDIDTCDAEVRR